MRMIIVLMMLFGATPPALAQVEPLPLAWQKTTEVYTTTVTPRILLNAPIALIVGTPTAQGPQTQHVWHTVDLKPYGVAANAKWAELSGLLVITRGLAAETATLWLAFRRPGDTAASCTDYIGQITEMQPGGQRAPFTVTVPLIDGKFEWCHRRSTLGSYPENSAYAANLVVQKWGR